VFFHNAIKGGHGFFFLRQSFPFHSSIIGWFIGSERSYLICDISLMELFQLEEILHFEIPM